VKPAGRAEAYYGKNTLNKIDSASLILISIILFSFFLSRFILGNHERSIIEARDFLGVITLPIIPRIIASDKEWKNLTRATIIMGALIAAYVLIQMATGFNIMGGRLEDLELSKNSGVRRSLLFGGSVVLFAMYQISENINRDNIHITVPALILIAAGIIGTFTRSLWISAAVGATLVAYLNGGMKSVIKTSSLGMIAVTLGLAGAAIIQPKVVNAAIDRATGIATEFKSGDSYGWRVRENEFALKAIQDHPITGVGLGGRYKPIEWTKGAFDYADHFIHNAYIGAVLKMGALGLVFLATIALLYRAAWVAGRSDNSPEFRRRRNALAGVMITYFLGGFISPSFLKFHGFLFLVICIIGTFPPSRSTAPNQHR
jgi:O-antigen ligase